MTIVAGIRIVLMSVPGSTITTLNPTPRSPRPSPIPFKPGTMPFAILISMCSLGLCVSGLHGPSQKLPHHTSQTDEHPEQAEREVSGYGGLLERGINQVLRQQASEPELDLNPAQTTFTDIVLVKVESSRNHWV
jgi:hypothetical protein